MVLKEQFFFIISPLREGVMVLKGLILDNFHNVRVCWSCRD